MVEVASRRGFLAGITETYRKCHRPRAKSLLLASPSEELAVIALFFLIYVINSPSFIFTALHGAPQRMSSLLNTHPVPHEAEVHFFCSLNWSILN